MADGIEVSDWDECSLRCLGRGEPNGTHMDTMEMAARPLGEDGPGVLITVNHMGMIETRPVPADRMPGRRLRSP